MRSLIIDAVIVAEGDWGVELIIMLLYLVRELLSICGASSHPWSMSFIMLWADL